MPFTKGKPKNINLELGRSQGLGHLSSVSSTYTRKAMMLVKKRHVMELLSWPAESSGFDEAVLYDPVKHKYMPHSPVTKNARVILALVL